MSTFTHFQMNPFVTKCALSLFSRDRLLLAQSMNTVHCSMTPVMSLGQDQNSNRVRLYHDQFYL